MLTSTLSVPQWWIAAVVAGAALAVAAQSTATTAKDKLIAVSIPLVCGGFIVLASAVHGYQGRTPLVLYTAAMIILVVLRIVFAGYISRQLALKRSGKPMEEMTGKQTAIFLSALLAASVAVVGVL